MTDELFDEIATKVLSEDDHAADGNCYGAACISVLLSPVSIFI